MSHWADTARRIIMEVHRSLPDSATLDERKAAVDAAYPFGMRKYNPYKTWLRARREYLCRYGYQPKGKPLIESPLERMMRRGGQGQQPAAEIPDGYYLSKTGRVLPTIETAQRKPKPEEREP